MNAQILLTTYLTEIRTRHVQPLKLAVEHDGRYVRVWAEINDDDESTEDQLWLLAASVNAQFSSQGCYLTQTIIEQSDRLNVPAPYRLVK